MRIEEASQLMGIPSTLIREIIEEHNIPAEHYLNGNHDLTFESMVKVWSVYLGTYQSQNTTTIVDWRQKVKVLQTKIRRLERKLEEKKAKDSTPPPTIMSTGKKWYPKSRSRKNEATV